MQKISPKVVNPRDLAGNIEEEDQHAIQQTVNTEAGESIVLFQTSPYRVRGCILTVMERLDEEFTKMLQACDAHSTEFVDRWGLCNWDFYGFVIGDDCGSPVFCV